jgi:hypothetical protein
MWIQFIVKSSLEKFFCWVLNSFDNFNINNIIFKKWNFGKKNQFIFWKKILNLQKILFVGIKISKLFIFDRLCLSSQGPMIIGLFKFVQLFVHWISYECLFIRFNCKSCASFSCIASSLVVLFPLVILMLNQFGHISLVYGWNILIELK